MKNIILSLLIFKTVLAFGQYTQFRPEVAAILVKMERCYCFQSERIGEAGESSKQYQLFVQLKSLATSDELVLLTKIKNNVIKTYAACALVDHFNPQIAAIFKDFLISGFKIPVQEGCVGTNEFGATELYYRLRNHSYYVKSKTDSAKVKRLIFTFDSITICTKPNKNEFLLNRALENITPKETGYNKIKELAIHDSIVSALPTLAKYKKECDVENILKYGKSSFSAIAEFPHPYFWNFLDSCQKFIGSSDFEIYHYFVAISSYKNADATRLLEKCFDQLNTSFQKDTSIKKIKYNKDRVEYGNGSRYNNIEKLILLHKALSNSASELYIPLIQRLWAEYRIIDFHSLQFISRTIDIRLVQSLKNGLLANTPFKLQTFKYESEFTDSIVPNMLRLIEIYSFQDMEKIVNHNIRKSEFQELDEFTRLVGKYKFQSSVEVLLDRLSIEKYDYNRYSLSKALLDYKDKEINKKVVSILKKNRKRKEKYGAENSDKAYRKLFKDNGLRNPF